MSLDQLNSIMIMHKEDIKLDIFAVFEKRIFGLFSNFKIINDHAVTLKPIVRSRA